MNRLARALTPVLACLAAIGLDARRRAETAPAVVPQAEAAERDDLAFLRAVRARLEDVALAEAREEDADRLRQWLRDAGHARIAFLRSLVTSLDRERRDLGRFVVCASPPIAREVHRPLEASGDPSLQVQATLAGQGIVWGGLPNARASDQARLHEVVAAVARARGTPFRATDTLLLERGDLDGDGAPELLLELYPNNSGGTKREAWIVRDLGTPPIAWVTVNGELCWVPWRRGRAALVSEAHAPGDPADALGHLGVIATHHRLLALGPNGFREVDRFYTPFKRTRR